jgi:hypothetical protein
MTVTLPLWLVIVDILVIVFLIFWLFKVAAHCYDIVATLENNQRHHVREISYLHDIERHFWHHLPTAQRADASADRKRLRLHYFGEEPPVGDTQ